MKAKHLMLALLVFIVSIPTIGSTYLLIAGKGPYAPTSSSDPIVSVSPQNTTVYSAIGSTFTVNITITNATNLYVWQVGIDFNATMLEALSFEEGLFLKQKGTTLWTNGTIDNAAGIIHYRASALAGNITGVSGNGNLGTITFRTKNCGNSAIQLTDVILLDSHLTDIDRTLVHGTAKVRISGDANGDRKVDIYDLYALGNAYGSDSSKLGWNPDCDFNGDGKVDHSDLTILNSNYGKTT
jgi:hypothetical protein